MKINIKNLISSAVCFSFLVNQLSFIAVANPYESAKKGHDAYEKKDYKLAGELYEKAYAEGKVNLYKENAIVAYMTYAFNEVQDKHFDNALLYCQKALGLNPSNENAKELLADIYYAKGADYFYTGNLNDAEKNIHLSLKYATMGDQKKRANEGLTKIKAARSKSTNAMAQSSSIPTEMSMPDTVKYMEAKLYGQTYESIAINERLVKMEKDVFGKTYPKEQMVVRVKRLKDNLFSAKDDNPSFSGENNYIEDIIAQCSGHVSIFGSMPIPVYISTANTGTYRKVYTDAVKDAFDTWSRASGNLIQFSYVNIPGKAQLTVDWQDEFEDFPFKPTLKTESIEEQQKKAKYRSASKMVRVGSIVTMVAGSLVGVPIIAGLGSLGGSVASPLLAEKGLANQNYSSVIKVNTKLTKDMTDNEAKQKIKQIALHQIGHSLGIAGHSSNINDVMFENFTAMNLSERDINTIREIYKPRVDETKPADDTKAKGKKKK